MKKYIISLVWSQIGKSEFTGEFVHKNLPMSHLEVCLLTTERCAILVLNFSCSFKAATTRNTAVMKIRLFFMFKSGLIVCCIYLRLRKHINGIHRWLRFEFIQAFTAKCVSDLIFCLSKASSKVLFSCLVRLFSLSPA